MLLKQLSFWLALLGIGGTVWMVQRLRQKPPAPAPMVEPARSPFTNSVAASGLIEAARENVRIGSSRTGLVSRVWVEVGSRVKSGDPLLELDSREAGARLGLVRAQVTGLEAGLKAERVLLEDARDQFARVEKLESARVASEDERTRKRFLVANLEARVEKLRADIEVGRAQVRQAEVDLELLTVRAPRDGVVLQLNCRSGEFAANSLVEPLMVLGDVERFQVRADVDEQNAPLVRPNQPAVAFLKGETRTPMKLRFLRIDPYVIPKKSLTGDSAERVDTRVLQIIFELERPEAPVYVGQQVDVFIQR